MDLKPPCSTKDAIHFDFHNLSLILDFLENSNTILFKELSNIKDTIKVIPEILNEIKELKNNQDLHKIRIESTEESIVNHHKKILDLETNQKGHSEVT